MDMDLQQENKRLAACLHKANAQAEHFEREWYLRGDALEAAAQSLDTIARLAGKDEYLKTFMDVRLYAASRARVAEAALKDAAEDHGNMAHADAEDLERLRAAGLVNGEDGNKGKNGQS